MAGCIFFLLLVVLSSQSSGYKLHATSECRTLKIFADGTELASLGVWPGFGETDKSGVDIPGNTTTIQLQCIEPGPTGGILASADNGLKTDGSWTCSSDSGATWKTASFISREFYYSGNDISDDAKVIWIHDFSDGVELHSQDTIVFCKTDVANTTSDELIPCDNGICPPNSSCCENQCCPSECNCGCWGCWCGGGLGLECPVIAPSCPVLKTVGDICYERLENNVDTSSYGCTANCTYKKIQVDGSEDEKFCFAPGVFPVNNYKCQNLETDEPGATASYTLTVHNHLTGDVIGVIQFGRSCSLTIKTIAYTASSGNMFSTNVPEDCTAETVTACTNSLEQLGNERCTPFTHGGGLPHDTFVVSPRNGAPTHCQVY